METQDKKKAIKMGSFLVIIFLLIYIPSLFHWIFGGNVSTGLIRIGTIEDAVSSDAYIIRDEAVLKSPFAGNCIIEVNEGERIPANARIATILKDSSSKLYDELKNKDLEILKAQKQKAENQHIFSDDLIKIDNEIAEKLGIVIDESNKNSLAKTKQLSEDIDKLIQRKAEIFGSKSKSDTYINSLKSEKLKLEQQIKQNTREIFSETSGIISYTTDGYEDNLKPESIKNLTPQSLSNIKPKPEVINTNNMVVEVDKPFAKIIRDIEAHIVTALDVKKAETFKVDDIIKIRINEIGKTVDGTVDYKSNIQDGKCIISVKIDKGLSDTAGMRKLNVDLIKRSYEGLKVPLNSLIDIDSEAGKATIVLAEGNYASVKEVKIIGKNEESAIIDNPDELKSSLDGISLYDSYIINPGKIQEGQMIN